MPRKGFLTIAFDAPYHGERAVPHAGLKLGLPNGWLGGNDGIRGPLDLAKWWCHPDHNFVSFYIDL